jgi:GT2 family glycosyltransferase
MAEPLREPPAPTPRPRLAVALATVHRPDDIGRAVAAARASGSAEIEIHVVDQGGDPATAAALAPHLADSRVRLHRQARRGLAAALNRACEATAADLVAITGDDCVMRADWLLEMERAFARDPRVAIVFGSVVPAPYDGDDGFVPGCVQHEELEARGLADLARLSGTTACMGVRRTAWRVLGGFDEALGVGAPLRSGEDLDLALRALAAGWLVVQTPRVEVEHRSPTLWRDRAATIRRNWFGSGAAYAKGLKLAPLRTAGVLAVLAGRWRRGGSRVAATYGPRPDRLAMLTGFAAGLAAGLLWPIDRRRGRFRRPAKH